MKLPCPTVVFLTVLACQEAHAFVPVSQPPSRDSALAAHKDAWSTAAATVAGWTLASQVAVASVPVVQPPPVAQALPSTVIAAGAYVPEDSYSSLDMSMPSYNTQGVNEILSAPGSKLNQPGAAAPRKAAKPKKGEDPAKALARAQKEADKRAAQDKKRAETIAKMEAKKAERAAIQGRRNAVE